MSERSSRAVACFAVLPSVIVESWIQKKMTGQGLDRSLKIIKNLLRNIYSLTFASQSGSDFRASIVPSHQNRFREDRTESVKFSRPGDLTASITTDGYRMKPFVIVDRATVEAKCDSTETTV
jgi:hypothetical protein